MRTIAIANQKGGCGKTTTAINLAWSLSRGNRSVLLVDVDPQGHASLGLGATPAESPDTLADLLLNENSIAIDDLACAVDDSLAVVPGTLRLAILESRLAGKAGREKRLGRLLQRLRRPVDYVIVDCPPNLGILTFNALFAAEEAIVPVDASVFSVDGLARFRETVHLVEDSAEQPRTVRVLRTRCDRRTRFDREIAERLVEQFPGQVFRSCISRSVRFCEAADKGQAVGKAFPRSRGAAEYLALAAEAINGEAAAAERSAENKRAADSQRAVGEEVLFQFSRDGVQDVRLVGTFNSWEPAGMPMRRGPDGIWRTKIRLGPGEHQYRFLADGVWHEDPQNERAVYNDHGSRNSLIKVGTSTS